VSARGDCIPVEQDGLSESRKPGDPALPTALDSTVLAFVRKRKTAVSVHTAAEWRLGYWYAQDVLKGRFLEGEVTIAQDGHLSYCYARNVLNGRFPEREPTIAQSAKYS